MRLSHACCGIVLTLAAVQVCAQGIQAELDRSQITIQEEATLVVTVDGTQQVEPRLPSLPGLEARFRNRSSQMEWVNGKVTRRFIYHWSLRPQQVGKFRIDPVTVELGGQRFASEPLMLEVVEQTSEEGELPQVFATASVSDSSPFVGEQIVFVWRLYNAVTINGASLVAQEFGALQAEDLGEVRQYTTRRDGVAYEVREIRKALFAQSAGMTTIPAWTANVEVRARSRRDRFSSPFDDFFSRSRTEGRAVRTRPIELEVRALPDPPAEFSGLIGSFEVASSISPTELNAGESVTQRITISGTGNVQMIPQPAVAVAVDFKVYEDQPSTSLNRNGNELTGAKVFTRALVPLRAGALTVAGVELVFFDPEREGYVRRVADAIQLEVAPGREEDLRLTESLAPSRGKVAVRILGDDILPIYRGLDALDQPAAAGTWVFLGGPPLVFCVLLVLRRRSLRFAGDVRGRRRHEALRCARNKLASASSDGDWSLVLREFIGDKFGLEGAALTPLECRAALVRNDVDAELAAQVEGVLGLLEASQYGRGATDSLGRGEFAGLIDRIEKETGR
ncbi:MAG: BatD family protein [Acidobacteriota bacterium]|nr:BatD family protein [Acidobacteriota bacterium]